MTEQEDSSKEITIGSEKESLQTNESKGSSKELFAPETSSKGSIKETPIFHKDSSQNSVEGSEKEILASQSEDADIPSLERISGSEKEMEGDNTISEIRLRFDPNNPERGYIDKRSFWTASAQYVEIASSSEDEMNTSDRLSNNQQPRVNFYNIDHSENGSIKEEEMEVTTGSAKELMIEPEGKPHNPFKDRHVSNNSSMKNGDLESKESSKQVYRSEGENKMLSDFSTPAGEESEEDEKSYYSKHESMSSH